MSTLTISIDRTALSLAPLVLSGADDGVPLGITGYQEPAIQPRTHHAPDSRYATGSVALSTALQDTVLNFDVATDIANSETESRALIAELRAALLQGLSYEVTVTVNDAPPETWTCKPGAVGNATRTHSDMRSHQVVYPVSIPCYPVRSI